MTTTLKREKLQQYIKRADEKKLNAIFTILESEIQESVNWWEDDDFVKKLDEEFLEWKSGRDKGYSLEEIRNTIQRQKKNR